MYVNVFWPIGVQMMTVLLCAAYVLCRRYQGDRRFDATFFLPRAEIATANGPYPQWRLAFFSFWDQLNAIATSLPSPFIDVTSQSLLSNFVLIWTVLISIPYLGMRYSQEHCIGCLLILVSAAVSVTVQLQTGNPPLGRYKTADGALAVSSPAWYVLFMAGTVPAGVSKCYKQRCWKGVDLEVMYAALWSGWWQILWGLLMFPFNWIPLPPPAPANTPAEMGTYLSHTMTSFSARLPPLTPPTLSAPHRAARRLSGSWSTSSSTCPSTCCCSG